MNGYPMMTERLYLHKDENEEKEIYVEDSSLHQHHIDGIRFLYKQFKKKTSGVIINNPLGYGNSKQVSLFLNAIVRLLDKPILILCEENEEFRWQEHFLKLLQSHNVIIAAESPFVKKAVFINDLQWLERFCRREWAIIVVDNDAFLKKALQTKLRADFKIWITPVDMKEHLQTFASIFKWLFPKEKLNIDDFKAKPGDIKDAVAKDILLDAFLHDIVYRTHLLTQSETPCIKSEATPKKVSRKNKDVTGTKIKRSKRLSDSAGTSNGIQEHSDMEAGVSALKIPKMEIEAETGDFSIGNFRNNVESNKQCDVIDSKNSEMDVESFILNEAPIKYDPSNGYMPDYDDISRNSEESGTDLIDEMEKEPTIFNSPEKVSSFVEDAAMDVAENQENFIDSDTNSDSYKSKPKYIEETSQDTNGSECCDLVENQVQPEYFDNHTNNGIKDEIYGTHNLDTCDDKKSVQTVKVEAPDKIVVESPKKDLDSKIMEMDEQISKKFQGSLLDMLF